MSQPEFLTTNRSEARGQVLPLFALFLIALLAMAALAVDVSNAYAARRMYREVADASSLAGAQDLQTTTRAITSANRTTARLHAYDVVKSRLGGGDLVAAACNGNVSDFSFDVADCPVPNTPYRVSIKTPSPTCVACDASHSIQVTVRNPTFALSFAHVVGAGSWNVASTSIAGLLFESKYALMTLQPPHPKPNGSDSLLMKDLIVNGNNTVLNVLQGSIGTNTSAATTLSGVIALADGYFIDHYDDLSSSGDTWSKPDGLHPIGRHITQLILDPSNPYPSFVGAPATFTSQAAGEVACTGASYPTGYASVLTGVVKCYTPGVYADPLGFRIGTGSGSPDSAYLMPGVYSMTTGMTIRGTLAGGLIDSAAGVDILLPQTQKIDANNAVNILLNAGGSTCSSDACRATPAIDFAGTQMKTSAGFVLTIEVTRDNNCYFGATPIDSGSCNVTGNKTVNLAGNGVLSVAGVIYGPSDNMSIHANQTTQTGLVGQIISWSVTYTGGATLNQRYPGGLEIGVVRLDAGCTAPSTPCNQ